MDSYLKREGIPGYTGHVHMKKEVFGVTEGELTRQLVRGDNTNVPSKEVRQFYSYNAPDKRALTASQAVDRQKFSHQSREAPGWIAGTDQNLYPQHIPGRGESN